MLNSWSLDLDEGTFTLNVGGVSSIDPANTNCTRFRFINQASTVPSTSFTLSDCVSREGIGPGPVMARFALQESDLNSLKLLQDLGTDATNTFLEIRSGNMLYEDGTSNELSPISGTSAAAATVDSDVTSPIVNKNGFTQFDLNSGQFTISFSEPVNVATISLPGTLYFQHFSDVNLLHDIIEVRELDCPSLVCTNALNVTFPFPRSELNRIKLNRRVCSSAGNCWLTINGSFIMDMAGNPVLPLPNGLRSDDRYALLFIDDTTGPLLESFILNMTSRLLTLSFDEPVDTSACNFSGITLQGIPSVLPTQTHLYYTLTGGEILSEDGVEVRVQLSEADVNELQSRPSVATSLGNTYLSLSSSSLRDVSYLRNPVQPISAQMASVYQPDTAPPAIRSYILDLDSNTLSLTFSEPVLVGQLELSKLQISSSSSGGAVTRQLVGGTVHPTPLDASSVVVFTLSNDDATYLEERSGIATSVGDTFLTASPNFANDTNGVGNAAVPLSSAIQAEQVIPDTSAPHFVSFSLDIDTGELSLTFDDVINASTLSVNSITLQNGPFRQPLQWHTLNSGSSNNTLDNGFTVNVTLGNEDLNRVKQIRNLATSIADTYLTVTATIADDVFGADTVAVTDGNAIQASHFTTDMTVPVLNQWTFDLDRGQFILSFSETVDILTFQASQVTLLASAGGESYSLTGAASFIPSDASDVFALQLTPTDLNYIKSRIGLGTTRDNSRLAIPSSAIMDMSSIPLAQVSSGAPLQAIDVILDTSRPVLMQYSLDMNTAILSLTFDETVNVSTVETTALMLVNKPSGHTSSYILTATSSPPSIDSHVINITLSQDDLNALKSISDLASSVSDTYIAATENAARDMSGNMLTSITTQSAHPVTVYIRDSTSPRLVAFSLNMSSGELLLSFSETVRASTLDPTQLTIKSNPADVGRAIALTGGVVSQTNGPTLALTLSNSDLNQLKLHRDIATGTTNTFLSLTASAVQDQAGNSVVAVPNNNAQVVSLFTEDTVSPRLVSFDLNLDTRRATLTYDETIDPDTFVITGITFQNKRSSPTQSVTISALSSTDSTPGTVFILNLHDTDFNDMAAVFSLATMVENTFISVIAGVVQDMNSNPSVAIPTSNALQITNHTEDNTRPTLARFNLDLDANLLSLTFSETVNVTSFNPTQITLQNAASTPSDSLTLAGGTVNQLENNIIGITLTRSDLNQLKANSMLASLASMTYISLTSFAVQDMNSNHIEPIPMSNAQWVATFTSDSTSPILESFDLDFNTGTLSLSFDEPILVSTFDPTRLSLRNNNGGSLTLSDGSVLSGDRLTYVRLQLGASDLNELKRLRICTTSNQCLLSAPSSTISDVSNNPNSQASSLVVSGYMEDSTRPSVVRFTNFNLDAGSFTLEFSETIDSNSTAPSTLEFHSHYINATHTFNPSDTFNVSSDSPNLTFYLEMTDLNLLKLNTELCTHSSNCWLRLPAEFISDVTGNDILPILSGTMDTYHYPANFTPDSTPPRLDSYRIDLDTGLMTFNFNEVVNEATFTPLNVTFHNATTAAFGQILYDQGIYIRSSNGLTILWNMTTPDLNLLKAQETLFTSVSNSFISYYHLVDDVSGVSTQPRDAIQASAVLPDTTRPQLTSFLSFNFDNASFTLLFDEAVNVSSLNLEDLAIAEKQTFDTSIYDPVYMNPWKSQLFRNGTITNATHYIQPGRYILSGCPESLSFIFEDPTMSVTVMTSEMPGNTSSESTLESGSGSGDIDVNVTTAPPTVTMSTPYIDPYPVWLGGCQIQLRLPVREPWYHLTGGEAFYADERKQQIVIALNRRDARILKLNTSIAVDDSNTYIAYNDSAISDFSRNSVIPISLFNATKLRDGAFIMDTTPPALEAFDIDLNEGTLTLSFDDVIDLQSIVPTEILLLNAPGSNTSYQFQGQYYSLVPLDALDNYHVEFKLDETDLNAIKINTELATGETNTYISLTQDVAMDIYGMKIFPLPHNRAFRVQNFTADTTPPQLLNFTLDIENGAMELTFNEAVDPITIDFTGITIQNGSSVPGALHSLTGGFIANNNTGTVILVVQLLKFDRSAFQSITNLGDSTSNTFLTIKNGTISDMNGNPVLPVEDGQALQATSVVPQSSSPILESFTLDLNANFVILTFSKAVNPLTLNTSAIQVLNGPTLDAQEKLVLSPTSRVFPMEMNSILYVQLTSENEDSLKEFMRPIANSRNDSFLSIAFGAVYDFIGNPLNASSSDVFQAAQYIEGKGFLRCMQLSLL